ncbi:MAG: GIY-YIG nuclease family protein [Candidatus Portnoybacteria bacterium]|nr:GIY-YIG nuclease family protein [Candidatus Portnoybacteria bacterium]MDD4983174.1 GIY-YIG nuclease family protein [Candidatus Portnoybacteria bacterium]
MFYVYVLKSEKDGNCYTGFSIDLKKRVEEHNKGRVEITKNRRPLLLVYYEAFLDEKAARRQELFYKTGQGRRILKKRLSFIHGEVA